MTQLGSQVGQESLGRPTPDPGEEVMGDISEGEPVDGEFPAVVEPPETERECLQVRVAAGCVGVFVSIDGWCVFVCMCIYVLCIMYVCMYV